MTQRILLAGATGLIGGMVRSRLAGKPGVGLTSLVRSAGSVPGRIIDFEALCRDPEAKLVAVAPEPADVAICCLGTNTASSGSQAAMFRVDHDYVLAFAKAARGVGVRKFILVSAAGAGWPGFYLQTKGKVERAIGDLGFERVDYIRPGLLLGPRKRSMAAAIGSKFYTAITPILIGPLARFGAISAATVADAMVHLTMETTQGQIVHHNHDLRRLAAD